MSRPRSARASGAGGSRAGGGRPGVFVQAPRSDIFVTMLAIALGAMLLSCILLLIILSGYDFQATVSDASSPLRLALLDGVYGISDTVHL